MDILLLFPTVCVLEQAATSDGYARVQCITAFRKIYYDSSRPTRTYAGAVIGGGAWNLLIPGAAGTSAPPSWTSWAPLVRLMRDNQVVSSGRTLVDLGHVFAGLDASNHPTSVRLGGGIVTMRSNMAATTFVGDLGSVVVEYIYGQGNRSFYDVARRLDQRALASFYDGSRGRISAADMAGNADAYLVSFNRGETVCDGLQRYYRTASTTRYANFARRIGLSDTSTRTQLREEIFNAALAYAAASGRRGDVLLVLRNPGPGMVTPTFWEAYWNVSGWVLDLFTARIRAAT